MMNEHKIQHKFLFQLDGDQADVDEEEPDFYAEVPLPG